MLIKAAIKAESHALDDELVIVAIQHKLQTKGVVYVLARAVTIVYAATCYFSAETDVVPNELALRKAALWLEQNEAVVNHQVSELVSLKLMRAILCQQLPMVEALAVVSKIKHQLLGGQKIAPLTSEETEELQAYFAIQDITASSYFSLTTTKKFQLKRTDRGNGALMAVLTGLKAIRQDRVVQELTEQNLIESVIAAITIDSSILLDEVRNIITSDKPALQILPALRTQVMVLQKRWQNSHDLAAQDLALLTAELDLFCRDLSGRYLLELSKENNFIGDIELQIIAQQCKVRIQVHSHAADRLKVFNPSSIDVVHMFYSASEDRYHILEEQRGLFIDTKPSLKEFMTAIIPHMIDAELPEQSINLAAAILFLRSRLGWQHWEIPDADVFAKQIHAIGAVFANARQEKMLELMTTSSIVLKVGYQETVLKMAKDNLATFLVQFKTELLSLALNNLTQERQQYRNACLQAAETSLREWLDVRLGAIARYTDNLEQHYKEVERDLNAYCDELKRAYEQQVQAINKHYQQILRQKIAEYNAYMAELEEENRRRRRKPRLGRVLSLGGAVLGMFGGGAIASFFKMGSFGSVVTKGITMGLTSSVLTKQDPLMGMLQGGLFGCFGVSLPGLLTVHAAALAKFHAAIQASTMAGVQTTVNGGKLFENILYSMAASGITNVVLPDNVTKFPEHSIIAQLQDHFAKTALTTMTQVVLSGGNLEQGALAAVTAGAQFVAGQIAEDYGRKFGAKSSSYSDVGSSFQQHSDEQGRVSKYCEGMIVRRQDRYSVVKSDVHFSSSYNKRDPSHHSKKLHVFSHDSEGGDEAIHHKPPISSQRLTSRSPSANWRAYFSGQLSKEERIAYNRGIANGLSAGQEAAEKFCFGWIRAIKAGVVNYFDHNRDAYLRECQARGIQPNVTSTVFAGYGLARGALTLVPDTPIGCHNRASYVIGRYGLS